MTMEKAQFKLTERQRSDVLVLALHRNEKSLRDAECYVDNTGARLAVEMRKRVLSVVFACLDMRICETAT